MNRGVIWLVVILDWMDLLYSTSYEQFNEVGSLEVIGQSAFV